jgi:hypothetical protein
MKPDAKRELELPRRIKNAESVLSFRAKPAAQRSDSPFSEKAIYLLTAWAMK